MSLTAPVAQWTEHQPSKLLVVGSNPARGATIWRKNAANATYGGVDLGSIPYVYLMELDSTGSTID